MKAVVVIPARFKSTRYPGKPLVSILNKPMILWVAESCAKAFPQEDVYVATEDERILRVVKDAGFNAIMTGDDALTGTDRIAEAAEKIKADIYLNVQGDEPILNPADILKVKSEKEKYPKDIVNAYCVLDHEEKPDDVNIPKVIITEDSRLVYMSRRALPGFKAKENAPTEYYRQVCIYAFSGDDLKRYRGFGRKSKLEQAEDIEILRFLEWGSTIRMVQTSPGSLAVDVPTDVDKVEKRIRLIQNCH